MIIVKMPEKTPIATYLVNSSETGSILPEVCEKNIFNVSRNFLGLPNYAFAHAKV